MDERDLWSIAPDTEGYYFKEFLKLWDTPLPFTEFRRRLAVIMHDMQATLRPAVMPTHFEYVTCMDSVPDEFQLVRIVQCCRCNYCMLYVDVLSLQ